MLMSKRCSPIWWSHCRIFIHVKNAPLTLFNSLRTPLLGDTRLAAFRRELIHSAGWLHGRSSVCGAANCTTARIKNLGKPRSRVTSSISTSVGLSGQKKKEQHESTYIPSCIAKRLTCFLVLWKNIITIPGTRRVSSQLHGVSIRRSIVTSSGTTSCLTLALATLLGSFLLLYFTHNSGGRLNVNLSHIFSKVKFFLKPFNVLTSVHLGVSKSTFLKRLHELRLIPLTRRETQRRAHLVHLLSLC